MLYEGKPLIEAVSDSLVQLIRRNEWLEKDHDRLKKDNQRLFDELHPDLAKARFEGELAGEIRLLTEQG